MEQEPTNLPAQIAEAIVSIPKGLTPGVIKALDRLVGATVDIPVAWLQQKKAKIDAQTESYKLVENAIAQAVATGAAADEETAQRAMNVLVRKEYRKQVNREAVAIAMVEDLREQATRIGGADQILPSAEPDEDWLNVFERYAEDASSERLQGLWGRVLAGELRKPGRYSTRTLRFLSEFSQADALTFETFSKCAFGDSAPTSLAKLYDGANIRHLIYLESSGLIQGVSGGGLQRKIAFNEQGASFMLEGDLAIVFKGEPNSTISQDIIALTPLGQELLSLVPSRKPREVARAVALASRVPNIHDCYLGIRVRNDSGEFLQPLEVLWVKETEQEPVIDGTSN
ncbi:DUF2806 domain-containing protein [Rhodobacter lacus]|uniref:DUF2806 domain-containing protein n=1 Tax=Rhodobacter lacus TaxID=1641972 RepID=A0ABW5A7G7_9RHOB